MIDAAGGKIEVDSKPDEGTLINLYIKKIKVGDLSIVKQFNGTVEQNGA